MIIPMGAILGRISSSQPIKVASNCFVTSSPRRMRSGATWLNAWFANTTLPSLGLTAAIAAAVVSVYLSSFGPATNWELFSVRSSGQIIGAWGLERDNLKNLFGLLAFKLS